MIVLRTPKGWTGPKEVDGKQHGGLLALAPGADGRHARQPGHVQHPRGMDEELPARRSCSTSSGRLDPELAGARPAGRRGA